MIPDDVVEEVRARADIVDVVGEFVSLKKAGKDYKALCPFHDEKTPSFYVVPSKGFFNCFGCGESGDVFAFVMKRTGLDFVDPVKYVGGRAGVPVREVSAGRGEDPLRPLREVNAFAERFYQDRLWQWERGDVARRYLHSRGIEREAAERFGLGYAAPEWRALREAAAKHGIDDELLIQVGLVVRSDEGQEPYDRFRGRLVFPIQDTHGRVVAFGGRILVSGGGAKYLNSPETPLYHKGEVLYGVSWAKNQIRREEAALVVEGYMDLLSLASAGVENVVATLGTSLTDEHARLLSRYCTRAFLLFDSDKAGLKATFRAADTLLTMGIHPSVVTLPSGEDPDSLVHSEGAQGIRKYVEDAVDVLDRKLQILEERDYFSSIDRTRRALDRLLPTLRATKDPALRDIYVAKVAERTGVRPGTLLQELDRERAEAQPRRAARPGASSRARAQPLPKMGAERKILLLMLRDRTWIGRAAQRLDPEDFQDAAFRAIFQALVADPSLDRPPPEMDSVAALRFQSLLESPEELSQAGRVFDETVGRMKGGRLDQQLQDLLERIDRAEDEAERMALLIEKARLGEERREMGLDWSQAARRTLGAGRADPNPRT